MKILHIDSSSGTGGSAESLRVLLEQNAREQRYEARLALFHPCPGLAPFHPEFWKTSGNSAAGDWLSRRTQGYLRLKLEILRSKQKAQQFRSWIEQERPDLIHLNISPFQDFYAYTTKATGPRIPIVCHLRSWPTRHADAGMLAYAAERTRAFIAPSAAVAKAWEAAGIPRVEVIPNGVDIEPRQPANLNEYLPEHASFRRHVAVIARLIRWKNHKLLFKAWAEQKEHLEDCALLLLGDGPERESLQATARELGLESHIFFLGHRTDARAIMGACDALVLPSLNEPLGRVVLEAFVQNVPVSAFQSGGVVEMVEDGTTGFLAPAERPDLLVSNMRRLLEPSPERERIVAAAERKVQGIFSARSYFASVFKVFRQAVS